MTKKERIKSSWHRTYEKVLMTPYQRVLECTRISTKQKEALKREHEQLNPLALKREPDTLREKLKRTLREPDFCLSKKESVTNNYCL